MNIFKDFWITIYRSKLTLIFLALMIMSVYWYQNDEFADFNTLVAIFGGLITAYLGISKQTSDDDKVFRELFTTFNDKYSGDTNDLFNKLRSGEKTEILSEDRLLIIDYFNLCSEEFLWYKKNRIPSTVWKAWEAGMIENILIPSVKEIFIQETNTSRKKNSYYGLAEHLIKKM